MQKTVISYNEREIKEGSGSKSDIKNGYNLWIDIVDPEFIDLENIQKEFNLDEQAVNKIKNKSKKPQVRTMDRHQLTIFIDLQFQHISNLETRPIYFFNGEGWLITIHSSDVDLLTKGRLIFAERNRKILESSIDALYYSFLSSIVETYEQISTAVELKVFDVQTKAQYKPSKVLLQYLDLLSKQAIMLRRHFWHARDIVNYHTNMEEDTGDIKFLRMVYDDINQLIEMAQSYQETINSARDKFSNSVSLQLNDTMRVLTIFSTIILPLTLLLSVFELQGFDLNDITIIPKHFGLLLLIMSIIAGLTLLVFWKKQWIFSKDYNLSSDDLEGELSKEKTKRESKITRIFFKR